MLLFSTILPIKETLTKDAFIQLAIEWNQGSNSFHPENVISDINWNGERNIRFGDDKLWLAIEEYRNENTIAIRYEKTEADGIVWDTDYVMNFNEWKMSVRLERSYMETAQSVDQAFSTPYFLRMLIDKGYIVDDGNLPILRKPMLVDASNLDLLADVINGKSRYRLPVVYVSRTFYDEDPVELWQLAKRLKGVAHVLAQKSSVTNSRLRGLCDSKNEYYGAIGVYFPNQAAGHKKFMYREYEGCREALLEKVCRSVIQYCNSQMTKPLYTWQGVNNALLRDRLTSQREERLAAERAIATAKTEALDEANKLIDGFDDDMKRLQRQVEELTRANEALTYENQGLRAKLESRDSVPILYLGEEDEFFQGEIKEMILKAVSGLLTNTVPDTRQAHVLRDILDSNGGFQGTAAEKAEEIKHLLKGYKTMSGPMRQELSRLGFVITEEGKHYKLTYYGDGRYWTTISKTASDGHTGGNAASKIIKNML